MPRWLAVVALGAALIGCEVYVYDLGIKRGGGEGGGGASSAFDFEPPFTDVRLVTELSDATENDDDPSLTSDLMEVYFSSRREGGMGKGDIWRSVRDSVDDPWSEPTAVEALNSELDETTVAVAPNGQTIWVSSNREGSMDIFTATRPSREEDWGEISLVEAVNTEGDEVVHGLSRNTGALLFAWRDVDESDYDLYFALPSGEGFGAPTPIAELNTVEDNEADPFLAGGELVLFYTSNQSGDDDLMVAMRSEISDEFEVVRALEELNSDAPESDAWVSEDLRYIMFASKREDDQFDLYEARR